MGRIAGIHPVREALLAGREIDRVHVARGVAGPRIQEILDLCRQRGIPIRIENKDALDRMVKGLPHQGVIANDSSHGYASIENFLDAPGLIVALDGVEDPHNLGAIIRTAHAAGARAVVIPERRAVGLTETVEKSAAGALSLLPVIRVSSFNQALTKFKDSGFWIYGIDERGKEIYTDTDFDAKAVLVLGGEGKGLHEQVRKQCDFLLRIPMAGQIASLNVSVAAGVVLFEWLRKQGSTKPA